MKDWALHTPAGAAWLNHFDLGLNQAEIRPRLLQIDGDLHLPTTHDGERSMLGGETPFLLGLTVPHRYWRKTTTPVGVNGEEGDATTRQVLPVLLVEMLLRGAGTEDTWYPRVASANAVLSGRLLQVTAALTGPVDSATVWLSWSDDRIWNEIGQAPWISFPLTQQGATWEATVDLQAARGFQDKVIAWFVDARNDLVFDTTVFPRRDASPVRFLNEPPPVPCDAPPQPSCAGD